jgi:methyl-accepting chemotaxis protein
MATAGQETKLAGAHGKGFAVVADEVRKLAERSGRETKPIAELIAQVQTGTREAVAAMDRRSSSGRRRRLTLVRRWMKSSGPCKAPCVGW